MTEWRISTRVHEQFKAFISGFTELIPQDLINVFDERELELLIVACPKLTATTGKSSQTTVALTEQDQVVQWFWQCVRAWATEKKSRLLQFATGHLVSCQRFQGPASSDGLDDSPSKKSGDVNQLPKSHTCFNRIDLPP